jgi:hypothetical protein
MLTAPHVIDRFSTATAEPCRREFVTAAQPFGRIGVAYARPIGAIAADLEEFG